MAAIKQKVAADNLALILADSVGGFCPGLE